MEYQTQREFRMTHFKATILSMPCDVYLDDAYMIDRAVIIGSGLRMTFSDERRRQLEQEFESQINACKEEDEGDGADHDAHMKFETWNVRRV